MTSALICSIRARYNALILCKMKGEIYDILQTASMTQLTGHSSYLWKPLPTIEIFRNYSYFYRSNIRREWDACSMRLRHHNSACLIFTWRVIWRVMSRVRCESRVGHSQFTSPYRLTRSSWCYPKLKHINLNLLAPMEHSTYRKKSRYPAGHLVDIAI